MRTEKELLQVLLDNMDRFETGLCHLTGILNIEGVITFEEEFIIDEYVYENSPEEFYIDEYDIHYKWVKGEKQPRIDWLNEQINKL